MTDLCLARLAICEARHDNGWIAPGDEQANRTFVA